MESSRSVLLEAPGGWPGGAVVGRPAGSGLALLQPDVIGEPYS